MAKTIANITGTALLPGVSANKRWYKPEHVAEAVRRARERIEAGSKPMVMLTFHGADDNTREVAASLTDVSLNENGGMDFAAGFADTPAGWDIARLADTTDGKPPHLRTVSIRGAWVGRVRKERAPSGELAETADGVELDGVDFTRSPGVPGAEIKTFAWAKDGTNETTERVLITESVQEAHVTTISEDAPPAPDGIREAVRSLLPLSSPHVLANGICVTCPGVAEAAKDPKKPFGDVVYADPGYQKDGKKRYPLDSEQHVRSAWSYVNQAKNAAMYTAAQLKRIKGRIKSAMGKIGATVAAEGWAVSPAVEVTEALAEFYGDPECAGSYSLSATNGPTTVTVCSYGLDPADLQAILAQACKGAGLALSTLDPDMDADIDLPGEQESAEDPDALAEEAGAPDAVTETAPVETPAPEPAADREGTEVLAMSETTTTEAVAPATAAAPSVTVPEDLVRKYEKKLAKKEAARRLAAGAPAESAAEAPAPSAVTETDDARIARIVEERLAAARAETPAAPAVTETEDQRINRIVEERLVRERQELTASGGGPGRKGLVTEHSAAAAAGEIPPDFPMRDGAMKPMEEWSDLERRAVGRQLESYVLGSRASQ